MTGVPVPVFVAAEEVEEAEEPGAAEEPEEPKAAEELEKPEAADFFQIPWKYRWIDQLYLLPFATETLHPFVHLPAQTSFLGQTEKTGVDVP